MDETDLQILMQLFNNSRMTFRELGEKSELSVSAVHKRVTSMIDIGIIRRFVARPSIHELKNIFLFVEGKSNADDLKAVCDDIGIQENVWATGYAAGNLIYLIAFLRDITELNGFSIFISRFLKNPRIGIINLPYQQISEHLTTIDYKIIKSLLKDARKPVIDISDETGLSAKTTKRRIDRMVKNDLIRFTLEWNPIYENCFVTVFTLELKEGMESIEQLKQLYAKYQKNYVVAFSYSNIPNMLTFEVVTSSAFQSQKIQQELQTDGYKKVTQMIWVYGKYYETWIDALVQSK